MASIIETLGKELEAVERDYAEGFAGQSRLTRDLGAMDALLARANSVLERIDRVPTAAQGPELTRLRETASECVRLYSQERRAIQQAHELGPTFYEFGDEATNANYIFARYARHFAGKDRATRDLALLGELVDDLKQVEKRMSALLEENRSEDFERDRKVVRDSIAHYQSEIGQINDAQQSGTPEQRASTLATLANAQFALYQTHFAGEPRISRRPALLMRIVSSLKKIHERMLSAKESNAELPFNDKNIGIVEERLKVYETELIEVRKVRQATAITDIMGELGNAANKLFDEYRTAFANKPRTQVDLEKLANICDKLGEVRRQMADMSRAEESAMNADNLEVVTNQLQMFEGEYEAVLQAKRAVAPASNDAGPA
jgi:hypothetical protein